jgi:hypothetical protein
MTIPLKSILLAPVLLAVIFILSRDYLYNSNPALAVSSQNELNSLVAIESTSTTDNPNLDTDTDMDMSKNFPVHPWLKSTDLVYNSERNTVPIVNEEYNLVFFLTAKVASTEFVRFLARLQNNPKWCKSNIHHPQVHNLRLLNTYSQEEALEIMTNPKWTKAIFVRHPKSRLLSAFLDKAIQFSKRFESEYCRHYGKLASYDECVEKHEDFEFFLRSVTRTLKYDVHWRTIYSRIDEKWWPYINFVGQMDNLKDDAKRLFSSVHSNVDDVSAWDRIGESGWNGVKSSNCDDNLKAAIPFLGKGDAMHTTSARDKMKKYYTPELEGFVERKYADDLQNPFFSFTPIKLFPDELDDDNEEMSIRASREINDRIR